MVKLLTVIIFSFTVCFDVLPSSGNSSETYKQRSANQSEAKNFLFEEKNWLGFKKENNKIHVTKFPTLISSWKTNYNSWKNMKKNLLLVKYENLLANPKLEFIKIIDYLEKLLKINFNEKKNKKCN